jgi:hypothetical protein
MERQNERLQTSLQLTVRRVSDQYTIWLSDASLVEKH